MKILSFIKKRYVSRITIPIVIVVVIAAGIGAYFVFQKSALPGQPLSKCGDGICSQVEREKGTCPLDCKSELEVIKSNGAVKYIDLEGGFYGLAADNGEKYDPVNLPDPFKKDGLKVSFEARKIDQASIHMWGVSVQIIRIKKQGDQIEKCLEDWQCGDWSGCQNGKQTRTCSDLNQCGTILNKPSESQNCQEPPPNSKTQEKINEDSPFATNDFGIPSGVAKAVKITTKEQMTKEIEQSKIPRLEDIGVKWARQHPNYFGTFGWTGVDPDRDGQNLDFTLTDALVKLGGDFGIRILAGLSPLPFDTEWQTASTYIPQNQAAYSSYVKQTVERYDGDGADDMPGLALPIKYWQLENEPDLHNKVRATPGNPNYNLDFSNASQYFEVLKLTYNAVKDADPESKVMINVVGYGQNMGDTSVNYLNQLNNLGAKGYYDIFSYHIYPDTYDTSVLQDTLQNKFQPLVMGKTIWITEGGINGKLGESEINQAAWVIKDYVFHIANGVKKIDWLTFKDMSPSIPETMIAKYSGLTTSPAANPPSIKKLSYYTYKKMVEVLEGSDWDNIQKIQESGGIYIYKFTKNNKPIWVAWNDNASQNVTISGISSSQAEITETIPDYSSGQNVTDYSTAFKTEIKTVSNNQIVITLGDKPVFVEEK